jgi:hypothetical protein
MHGKTTIKIPKYFFFPVLPDNGEKYSFVLSFPGLRPLVLLTRVVLR